MVIPMSHLEPGMTGYVTVVGGQDPLRRRLLDLGFTPGARVAAVRRGPLGSPTVYLIRGALIALRPADSRTVLVETVPVDTGGNGSWD